MLLRFGNEMLIFGNTTAKTHPTITIAIIRFKYKSNTSAGKWKILSIMGAIRIKFAIPNN